MAILLTESANVRQKLVLTLQLAKNEIALLCLSAFGNEHSLRILYFRMGYYLWASAVEVRVEVAHRSPLGD